MKESNQQTRTPRIIGKADVSFGVHEEKFVNSSKKNNNKETKKHHEFSKMNSIYKNENEYLLFNDDFMN